MQVRLRSIAKGLATQVPALAGLANSRAGSAVTSHYYYSVWLRHLRCTAEVSDRTSPACVAELGPGDSLGLGLAAMLCGADRYYGLDRLRFANAPHNLKIFDELVELFRRRAPMPGDDALPHVHPRLPDYAFPSKLLDDARMERALDPARLERIRRLVATGAQADGDIEIRYFAPWDDAAEIRPSTVDWVFSQAVLEHVDDVDGAYANLLKWLRPGGLMSHRIDYSSHGITRDWNGHWTVSEPMWKLIRGNRAYLINRLPHSRHVASMKNCGFEIKREILTNGASLPKTVLSTAFREIDASDIETSGAFIVAAKPETAM